MAAPYVRPRRALVVLGDGREPVVLKLGLPTQMIYQRFIGSLLAAAVLLVLPAGHGRAEQPTGPAAGPTSAASDIADFFRKVGDQIYEYCIFELSQEQLEVQHALI